MSDWKTPATFIGILTALGGLAGLVSVLKSDEPPPSSPPPVCVQTIVTINGDPRAPEVTVKQAPPQAKSQTN